MIFFLVNYSLGHNWGSNHDPDTDECSPSSTSGGRFLMFSRALKGVANNNLVSHLDLVIYCTVLRVETPSLKA